MSAQMNWIEAETRRNSKLALEVGHFVSSSEDRFTRFGSQLHNCLGNAQLLIRGSQSVLEKVSGARIGQVLVELRGQAKVLHNRSLVTERVLKEVRGKLELTREAVDHVLSTDKAFSSMVRTLKVFSVVARLAETRCQSKDERFSSFAASIKDLAQQVEENTSEMQSRSEELRASIGEAIHRVSASAPVPFGDDHGDTNDFDKLLEAAARPYEESRQIGTQVAETASELASQISAIIRQSQFQDITRQRLEHLRDSLDRVTKWLTTTAASQPDEERGQAARSVASDLARIHGLLLAEGVDDFSLAIEGITERLQSISNSVSEVTSLILQREQDGEDSPALAKLHATLESMLAATNTFAKQNDEIAGLLRESVRRSEELSAFIDRIDSIGNDFEFAALNAILATSQVGERGRALAAVALELRQQCNLARELTEVVATHLTVVGTEARHIETVMGTYTSASKTEYAEVAKSVNGLVEELGRESEGVGVLLSQVRKNGEQLHKDISEALSGMTLHKELDEITRDARTELEQLADLGSAQDDWAKAERDELLSLLYASYSSQIERELHGRIFCVALEADAAGADEDSSDDVEFF